MSTTSLLVVVGCIVCVKTLAFIAFVVRRDRRQHVRLAAARQARAAAEAAVSEAVPLPGDPCGWRLQWAEPGVMLVENTSDDAAARDVELRATLTASSGEVATVEETARFVGTGACFAARFADLEPWLADSATTAATARDGDREPALSRLACTLSYSMAWRTPEGERRRACRTAYAVVPVPDLSLDLA